MRLTEQIKQQIIHWEKTHPVQPCPNCGGTEGIATEFLFLLGPKNPDGIRPEAPFVPKVCLHCGYTRLFSAEVMGLLPTK